ncbi:MAG: 4-phosphoerythronate dehydrogenase [Ignavibacteriaceae bacterium]|jgi:erythronate-4-phosphate dehydrogenase|nr:4-phosphoerythronate dehydrogenase [Ignavibacteriaceae bacterium]
MLKIVNDENISFAKEAFNHIGIVETVQGRSVSNQLLKDADILIVRSITMVDEYLLKNTKIKFVGTTTIGTDHIDLDYLKKNKIAFADAKGCNAFSVAEYVAVSLFYLSVKYDFKLKDKSIGIVGVGNVGSKVARFAKALGMKVLLNDPPLERNGDPGKFVSLNEILKCDIVTLHTPLNLDGIDKTLHLINKENLARLNENTILINTSRGAVINNNDLLESIERKKLIAVLDVWENEPEVNSGLLERTDIATPHIAGYSLEGKINGTIMIYDALCRFLNIEKEYNFQMPVLKDSVLEINSSEQFETAMYQLISKIYPIADDDKRMRRMSGMNRANIANEFDNQRKNYPVRREFNNYKIKDTNTDAEIKSVLSELRFKII